MSASSEATSVARFVRHVTSINDLTNDEIESVFALAGRYLDQLADREFPYRIGSGTDVAAGRILACLFYEPSTRTRLSFESAMLRLGGRAISSVDPATSSVAKGESLADSVRVVENYADLIVIRHPRDGAARLAAEYSHVPVVNGGDGAHEHPTQTLCDLFTLRRENKELRGLNVAVSGDLRGSRTIHSFVYALARFGANIMLMPAKGMGLPAHVDQRLREEFNCVSVPKAQYEGDDASLDALYVTASKPHQLSLIPNPDIDFDVKLRKEVDVIYVTRFQKERWAEKSQDYPKIDAKFLKGQRYSATSVLHPLPRVGELDIALDSDARAVYFRQAAYGVPVRMALISLLLGLKGQKPLSRFEHGFPHTSHPVYSQPGTIGIRCTNQNCIVHDPLECHYAGNKFYLAHTPELRLRCVYCETDIEHFVASSKKQKRYTSDLAEIGDMAKDHLNDLVFWANEADAESAGNSLKRPKVART